MALETMGTILCEKGNLKKARENFERAVTLEPEKGLESGVFSCVTFDLWLIRWVFFSAISYAFTMLRLSKVHESSATG